MIQQTDLKENTYCSQTNKQRYYLAYSISSSAFKRVLDVKRAEQITENLPSLKLLSDLKIDQSEMPSLNSLSSRIESFFEDICDELGSAFQTLKPMLNDGNLFDHPFYNSGSFEANNNFKILSDVYNSNSLMDINNRISEVHVLF